MLAVARLASFSPARESYSIPPMVIFIFGGFYRKSPPGGVKTAKRLASPPPEVRQNKINHGYYHRKTYEDACLQSGVLAWRLGVPLATNR